jgi:hypothetical protein
MSSIGGTLELSTRTYGAIWLTKGLAACIASITWGTMLCDALFYTL